MSEQLDDLEAEALAETLANCIGQLQRVRARAAAAANGRPNPDELALMQTLDGVEALLIRLGEYAATKH